MTVEDLKKLLKQVDDETVITIGVDPLNGEFCSYSGVISTNQQTISMLQIMKNKGSVKLGT